LRHYTSRLRGEGLGRLCGTYRGLRLVFCGRPDLARARIPHDVAVETPQPSTTAGSARRSTPPDASGAFARSAPVSFRRLDEGDEEVARIREVRHRISEEFGHDPYRMVAYYMELQKEHPEKLVRAPHSEAAGKKTGRQASRGIRTVGEPVQECFSRTAILRRASSMEDGPMRRGAPSRTKRS
jgi:hypothetical protein